MSRISYKDCSSKDFTVYEYYLDIKSNRISSTLFPLSEATGNTWSLEKKELFLDSLIRNYSTSPVVFVKKGTKYLILDGKQRIDTIVSLIIKFNGILFLLKT